MSNREDIKEPVESRRFEDYAVGSVCEYGPISISEDEMVEFAEFFDPQSFHVDRELAKIGPFGEIVASGLHSLGIAMKLFVENYLSKTGSLGSPGLDTLRFLQPVRPNEKLKLRVTVIDARRSRSQPAKGIVKVRWELLNGQDEAALSLEGTNFLLVRDIDADIQEQ
jgi:acyl dehydratase